MTVANVCAEPIPKIATATKKEHWNDGFLKVSFFGLNGGLALMSFMTLFPVGIMQAWTSFKQGLWLARDASFFERGIVVLLGNLRMIPDTIIIVLGVLPLAYFLFSTYRHLKPRTIKEGESVWDKLGIDLQLYHAEQQAHRHLHSDKASFRGLILSVSMVLFFYGSMQRMRTLACC